MVHGVYKQRCLTIVLAQNFFAKELRPVQTERVDVRRRVESN